MSFGFRRIVRSFSGRDTSVTPIFPLGIVIAMVQDRLGWGIGLGIFNGYEVPCAVSVFVGRG